MGIQVGPPFLLDVSLADNMIVAEEFNKYLSYVRNLGFEDTPDYDFLRDLFTQALKNTGEVEDGEYDWMKLNNGKGWEAMKHHPSQHLHAANQVPNSSAKALLGGTDTPRGPGTPGLLRLNSTQPQPPKPGVTKQGRPGASVAPPQKRTSGVAGGLTADMPTPTASTQAQPPNSQAYLPNNRMSTANPPTTQTTSPPQNGRGIGTTEEQPTAVQKVMKVLCCGGR